MVGYNRWKQSKYPLDDNETQGNKAIGFEEISIAWRNNYFGGLVRSSYICSILDGSAGDSLWYYAIGTYRNCDNAYLNSIPGPTGSTTGVRLWMRIYFDNKPNTCFNRKRLLASLFFMIIIIISQ